MRKIILFAFLLAAFPFLFAEDVITAETKPLQEPANEVEDNETAETPASEEETPLASLDIQPRSEDGQWLYKSYYYEDGNWKYFGRTIDKVIETKEIEGVTCYFIEMVFDGRSLLERLGGVKLLPEDYTYYWEYMNENGSYIVWVDAKDDVPTSLDDFDLTRPYPTQKGHSYSLGDEQCVVLGKETITTSLGAFECLVYQLTYINEDDPDYSSRERYYQSPGTGLVRWEMDAYADGEWVLDLWDDLVYIAGGSTNESDDEEETQTAE